jgi:pimeloyl-ACP methyl ester carboxylesterase
MGGIPGDDSNPGDVVSRRGFLKCTMGIVAGAVVSMRGSSTAQECSNACNFNFIQRDLGFVRLPCGRRLAYSEVGDADASWVIINHHGLFSGRIDSQNLVAPLRCTPGVRVITPERPGIGMSDPDPAAGFLTWPSDVSYLADALGIQRFAILAVSDGTPFALAVARAMPDRAMVVALQSPIAPLEFLDTRHNFAAFGARNADRHYEFTRFCISRYADPFLRHPDGVPLRYALSGPAKHEQMAGSSPHINNSFAQGPDAVTHYIAEMGRPWAWWLKDIPTKVRIQHGCEDRFAPPATIEKLTKALPNAELRFYPGQGHASLLVKFVADRLAAAMPPV